MRIKLFTALLTCAALSMALTACGTATNSEPSSIAQSDETGQQSQPKKPVEKPDQGKQTDKDSVGCASLNEKQSKVMDSLDYLKAHALEYRLKGTAVVVDKIINKRFNSNLQVMKLVPLFALGATIDKCNANVSNEKLLQVPIIDKDKNVLVEYIGSFDFDRVYTKGINEKEGYYKFLDNHREVMSQWPN